jgi:hypothetical protein
MSEQYKVIAPALSLVEAAALAEWLTRDYGIERGLTDPLTKALTKIKKELDKKRSWEK